MQELKDVDTQAMKNGEIVTVHVPDTKMYLTITKVPGGWIYTYQASLLYEGPALAINSIFVEW